MQAVEAAEAAAAAGGSSAVRLYVGGIGPAVINSDLFQTFSSLVRVSSVELVRTKGRGFAYVTIQAAPHDIKRLFSLYNGCMWKGGRLKLEKAREFYMDKLSSEWAERDRREDSNIPKSDPVTTSKIAPNFKESGGLKMYFPKLRKVKNIPEKGLGKHKRSFERVEPLPHSLLRICNCDQDCITTCNYQSLREIEPLGMAEEDGRQDSESVTIKKLTSEAMSRDKRSVKEFRNKGGKVFNRKLRDGNERQGQAVPYCDDVFLNIEGGTLTAETDGTEGITDANEPILSITGLIQEETKNSGDRELHTREVKVKVNGAFHKQRRCQTEMVEPDNCPRNEERDHGENEEVTDQVLQGGGSKFARISEGKTWVQKASWKTLVGGNTHVSFSLGKSLDLNNHFTQQ